ncbi:hypothetical protein [Burkholderia sp. IMCC1007]|uniref:hypothetical protein n=1 Tax=Burkholderia sp. IMCC1007 TaxID=3004104 RepID=UPI0022B53403|nr:hypothetical protein [Burkholderia sp. IMCC1007]
MQITGDLAALIERLLAWRGSKVDVSPYLLRDEEGYPLTKGMLRSRFDKARELAGIDKAKFQFRDLRARGVTHKTIDEGLEAGQRLAGHSGPSMTARYVAAHGRLNRPADAHWKREGVLETRRGYANIA